MHSFFSYIVSSYPGKIMSNLEPHHYIHHTGPLPPWTLHCHGHPNVAKSLALHPSVRAAMGNKATESPHCQSMGEAEYLKVPSQFLTFFGNFGNRFMLFENVFRKTKNAEFDKTYKLHKTNLIEEPCGLSGLATVLAALCCFSRVSVALLFLNGQEVKGPQDCVYMSIHKFVSQIKRM